MLPKGLGRKISAYCMIVLLVMGVVSPTITKKTYAEENSVEVNSNKETIELDPSYQHEPFDGWGTALVWFANVTGGWPDELRNELADDLFGKDGLNFNIARYNIGGGDSPETAPYMRKGGAVPGYWNRPAEFGPPQGNTTGWKEQANWWDSKNPDHWNWNADANQRWWLEAAKSRGADTFEAFSNSAPYFMTQSGYVSGNWNSWDDNLKADQFENFATYLTTVVDHLQKDLDVEFKTLSPINEPFTGYWGAKGRQEGSNWSRASQSKIINEVKKQLDEKQLSTVVSAMDETHPQRFRENWEQYNAETRSNVGQLNVHTYWPEQQVGVRDIAKSSGKRLWMSEVDLSPGGIGQSHTDIRTGLGLSERITSDIQKLEPEAWVLWQAIEDEVNMNPEHENANWGLIQVDFDPKDFSNVKIYKNKKYYAMGNYSKFIRPGSQVINSNSSSTLAAINKQDESLVLVYTNSTTDEKALNFDLSGFETVKDNAEAVPYVTSATDNIAKGSAIKISDKKLSAVVKPQSITTFVVSKVSGVAPDQSVVDSDEDYNIINKNSGKVLDIAQDQAAIVQKTKVHEKDSQSWRIQKVTNGNSNKEIYQIIQPSSGKVLGVENGSAILQKDEDRPSQKWILSTYGNGEYTFVNVQDGKLLEIGGQSKAEDARATVWLPNAGNNQVWKLVKAGITKIEPVEVVVPKKKTAPILPNEVTAVYGDGDRVLKGVVWNEIDPALYDRENVFTVEGQVEGTKIKANATVIVSKIESIEPVKIKTTPGAAPILPKEATAKLTNGSHGKVAILWDEIDPSLYAGLGKFTVRGKNPESPVKALAEVQVVKPALKNLALKKSGNEFPKASASFTGMYDSASNINDGIISSVRWTNWDPNNWRKEDWVAIDFGKEETISKVDFHFYDDGGGTRPAQSFVLQYWNGSAWVDIEGTQTEVAAKKEINLSFEPLKTSKIRAMMQAMPNTCIAISELMVWGVGETSVPSAGEDATLENVLINEQPLKDFKADTFTYQVEMNGRVHKDLNIKAITNDLFADAQINLPESLPGKAEIIVTSEDRKHKETYTIEFVNEDGTLLVQ
ncbi:glycoside hydrolase [Neobacillus bataviensis]|uniref:glycoside hydrolase n=1 Tax=Neobacillus bataviensis TaxID=220685 RepID=UPI001CBC9393|nr:glycoside hydrolase [Neobacillus bataviensis]